MDRWTEDEVTAYFKRFAKKGREIKAPVDLALSTSHAQRNTQTKRQRSDKTNKIHSRFRVGIYHCTRRLSDPGGRDYKPAIDGITKAGIWPDDSAKYIEEIRERQVLGETERTIIEVWKIDAYEIE